MACSGSTREIGWPLGAVTQWKLVLPASAEVGLELRNVSTASCMPFAPGCLPLDGGNRHPIMEDGVKSEKVNLTIRASLTTSMFGTAIVVAQNQNS